MKTLQPAISESEAVAKADKRAKEPAGTRAERPSSIASHLLDELGARAAVSTVRTQTRAFNAFMKDQRKAKRHHYVVVGAVLRPDGRYLTDMMVENISVGGLAFRSNQPFQIGDRPMLEVSINGRIHHIRVVVRRTFGSNSGRMPFGCGVEYINPSSEIAQDVSGVTGESAGLSRGYSFTDDSAA